jgi:hypothetical protein
MVPLQIELEREGKIHCGRRRDQNIDDSTGGSFFGGSRNFFGGSRNFFGGSFSRQARQGPSCPEQAHEDRPARAQDRQDRARAAPL